MTERRVVRIAVLPGDGVGPEVARAAIAVIEAVASREGVRIEVQEALIGGAAIDACGDPLPPETRALCAESDAVLLGAVGGPKWDDPRAAVRPEQGLLAIRRALGVYANLRPVRPFPELAAASPLKTERLAGVDVLFVRELTGGIYFGKKVHEGDRAIDECVYTVAEIERVVRRAAELARSRRGRLTSVDKANVLETSRLWRSVTTRVMREEYPDVELEHLLVDAMAMHLLARPADFDVVVTENMFGDILTDEASMLSGSLGMLPSASIGDGGPGLFEPVHGSAPDLAGRDLANPFGAILSGALLLRHGLGMENAAGAVDTAVSEAIGAGVRTADLGGADATPVGTRAAAAAVLDRIGRASSVARD
jgi:3-isopropylmalate dehydrogenase